MRIGIVGCGLIGRKRAYSAKYHNIIIVADLDYQRATSLAKDIGSEFSTNWKDVIEADLDAVIVSTTHDHLAEISLAALESGKHVLVEKPAARNSSELRPVVDAARRLGLTVRVGFNHRFHPALLKVKEIVINGDIGRLMYVKAGYGHGGRPGYNKEWRCDPNISGGGELLDQGSHLIDLSRWVLGDLELDYSFTPTCFWDISTEDNSFIALKSKSNQMAWLHASWTEWKNTFNFQIYGEGGKLTVDGLGGSYGVEKLTLHHMTPEMGPPETTTWEFPFPDKSWELEFEDFVKSIKTEQGLGSDLDDAMAVLKIIDKAYKGSLSNDNY